MSNLSKALQAIPAVVKAHAEMIKKAQLYLSHPTTVNLLMFTKTEEEFKSALRAAKVLKAKYE